MSVSFSPPNPLHLLGYLCERLPFICCTVAAFIPPRGPGKMLWIPSLDKRIITHREAHLKATPLYWVARLEL